MEQKTLNAKTVACLVQHAMAFHRQSELKLKADIAESCSHCHLRTEGCPSRWTERLVQAYKAVRDDAEEDVPICDNAKCVTLDVKVIVCLLNHINELNSQCFHDALADADDVCWACRYNGECHEMWHMIVSPAAEAIHRIFSEALGIEP